MKRLTAHPDTSMRPLRCGFSLVELMIAMAIFAIGSIAVASIFPVAILLQKATVADMRASHFITSAEAMVKARGFKESILNTHVTTMGEIYAVPEAVNDPTDGWHLSDRSYHSGMLLANRRVFWVPLFMDRNTGGELVGDPPANDRNWEVFLFIVSSSAGATYPKNSTFAVESDPETQDIAGNIPAVPGVRSISTNIVGTNRFDFANGTPKLVRVGDRVLDEFGNDWTVTASDPAGIAVDGVISHTSPVTIWFADPGDSDTRTFVALLPRLKNNANPPDANNLVR